MRCQQVRQAVSAAIAAAAALDTALFLGGGERFFVLVLRLFDLLRCVRMPLMHRRLLLHGNVVAVAGMIHLRIHLMIHGVAVAMLHRHSVSVLSGVTCVAVGSSLCRMTDSRFRQHGNAGYRKQYGNHDHGCDATHAGNLTVDVITCKEIRFTATNGG